MDAVDHIVENTIRVPADAAPTVLRALKQWKKPTSRYQGVGQLLLREFNWTCRVAENGDLCEFAPILSRAGSPVEWELVLALLAPHAYTGGVLVYETVRGEQYRFLLTTGGKVEWHKGRTVWEEF